jgi:hypothetical protein
MIVSKSKTHTTRLMVYRSGDVRLHRVIRTPGKAPTRRVLVIPADEAQAIVAAIHSDRAKRKRK